MESQPQNPEFRIYPENFHPWEDAIMKSPTTGEYLACLQALY